MKDGKFYRLPLYYGFDIGVEFVPIKIIIDFPEVRIAFNTAAPMPYYDSIHRINKLLQLINAK